MTKSVSEQLLKGLMLLSLDGDEAAYRRLLVILRDLLLAFYRRRLGSDADRDAEDLVQEVLLAVHGRRITYDRERPFTAWFFQIAKYKLIDHFRANGGKRDVEIALGDEIAAEFREEALFAHLDVDRLLDQLPAKQRELLRQVKIAGKTTAEAAIETGQSEAMVRVSIHRGMRAIGRKLGFANDEK
ncbi:MULTISPECIES: sigma-70 family RNA polymerase sigma factor [unclassified Rhizobium]|uniref:sigma-70 family RNA polymerase sigma factor n=1 Tax=unclassified Rhizobium TaxID=2613769 RepID=UPI00064752D7|nr:MULTISPECIES: sigma-70 family RNA polymerase sigma factor [unclassified Rhizobium]OJY78530.1 MAG: RNA polymerase subunit sigma-70 [Rhizobium sp. 60-20]RKD52051.1 RNA polymerase ECF family sigma subunit [Rhizobium sp. WW_1]